MGDSPFDFDKFFLCILGKPGGASIAKNAFSLKIEGQTYSIADSGRK